MVPIFVIGSSNTDMVVKAGRLPRPGETVLGSSFMMTAGGKGANQAVAASRLGGKVSLVASVGSDLFGQQALDQFGKERIDTAFVTTDTVHPSGVALINVDDAGENCIAVAPGANGQLTIERVEPALESITPFAIILVQLEIPLNTVEYVIAEGSRRGARVILNPAPAGLVSEEILRHLYLITPNESEAEYLTGIKVTGQTSAAQAAAVLHNRGTNHVIITMGAKGAFLSSEGKGQWLNAPRVKATDTTAAGDCFNGALAVALSENRSLPDAVSFACHAATISVTRMGAQASMPDRKEFDQMFPEFSSR